MVLSISVDTVGNLNRDVKPEQYKKMKEVLNYFSQLRNKLNHNAVIDTKTTVIDETAKDLFEIYMHCKKDLKSDTHSFQFLKGSPVQHADKEFQYEKIFEEPTPEVYKNIKDIAEQFDKIRNYCLSNNTKVSQDEQWLLQSLLRKGKLWPKVREHLKSEEFQTPHFQLLYAKLLELPDEALQSFDPYTLEESDPELFQSVMLILTEEIPSHDFGLSLFRMKERNLEIKFREWLLHSKSNEERAQAGRKRRNEETNFKDIKQIFDNL